MSKNEYKQKEMKKLFLTLAVMATTLACTADKTLTVKADMKNLGDSLIVVNPDNREWRDTIVVNDDKFTYTFKNLDSIGVYFLISPQCFRGLPGVQMRFVAVPGETLELTGDSQVRYDFGGSKFYQGYGEADRMLEAAQKPEKELTENLTKMMEQGVPRDSVMKIYQLAAEPMKQEFEKKVLEFIKTHPDLEASATLIDELSPEKMQEAAALLSEGVRNGRMKAYYQGIIDAATAQQRQEQEAAGKQAEGVAAPDFTLNDLQGKPLSLSSLRGKYVILDFWGSWCGWCIKGFPQMKEYYKKYQGKFEILGIDCNDSEQKWQAAVKQHELPWLHVYNPRDSRVLADYGIQGFPTKIILSPEGKIVRTIVGEDPAFYTLLDQLFGGK